MLLSKSEEMRCFWSAWFIAICSIEFVLTNEPNRNEIINASFRIKGGGLLRLHFEILLGSVSGVSVFEEVRLPSIVSLCMQLGGCYG